jgi:outer membrane scaffolding protein for murein synthesis (MipA/OmpV family)
VTATRRAATLVAALAGYLAAASAAHAAGNAPLAEWQSSAGVLFDQLDGEPPATWSAALGVTSARLAAYPGANRNRQWTSPIVDLRYGNRAFVSTEEGIGYNLPGFTTTRAGVALTYDYGRSANEGPNHALLGIHAAPEVKLFVEHAFTPVLLRFDVRHAIGGYDGWVADLSAYVALPLSKSLVLFAGPSITAADNHYLQRYYGINAIEAAAGAGPEFHPRSGLESVTLGANLVWTISDHWLVEGYTAGDRLLGNAANSPTRGPLSRLGGGLAILYQF